MVRDCLCTKHVVSTDSTNSIDSNGNEGSGNAEAAVSAAGVMYVESFAGARIAIVPVVEGHDTLQSVAAAVTASNPDISLEEQRFFVADQDAAHTNTASSSDEPLPIATDADVRPLSLIHI